MGDVLRNKVSRDTEKSWEFSDEAVKFFKSSITNLNKAGNASFFSFLQNGPH